ncbi:MAG: hypothetical protein H8E37_10325 [Planctomycetes bacterium]|nr:hypothetical protein [Planctomycetota bacterium]
MAINFRPVISLLLAAVASPLFAEDSPLDQRPQPWVRRSEPILSARTTKQEWCRVVCYSPHVIFHDGRFRMWYLGTSESSRSNDMLMGYAESVDGLRWTEHPGNPILSGKDIPWGRLVQTPFVKFDEARGEYRMWFVSGDGVTKDEARKKITRNDQKLAYATSQDGIKWKVHPKPLYPSGRSPSVIQLAENQYRMWMGSQPDRNPMADGLYQNIYEFSSPDGFAWKRSEKPVLQPRGPAKSTVYPFVIREGKSWYMWHGCHVDGGRFELFCAKSSDGTHWDVDHTRPAFAAREGKVGFDSKYTSTPCIVRHKNRLLMYYSARDWQTEYVDGDGKKQRDGAGVYSHIGVAELKLAN